VIAGVAEQRPKVTPRRAVRLRLGRLERLLGLPVDRARAEGALATLGIALDGTWTPEGESDVGRFLAPPHRKDLTIEEDLIEEVARVIGYDAIPSVARTSPAGGLGGGDEPALEAHIIRIGTGLGFDEAVNTVLVGTVPLEALPRGPGTPLWQLQNPISRELRHLRPSLLPGLLMNVARNLHHGVSDVRLIEVGKVFTATPEPLGTERVECAVVLAGTPDAWRRPEVSEDRFLELKGAVEALLEALGIDSWGARSYDQSCWAAGTGARLERNEVALGHMGQVTRALAAQASVEMPVWGAVLDLAALARAIPSRRVFRILPRYPASKRDLAIVVDRRTRHAEVVEVIRKHGGPWLEDVRLFDVFEGEQVGPGRKSMAYALDFRSPERTLSDREVDDALAGIVRALGSVLGATWRGGGAPTTHAAPTR
jgi:phenylalanyl-tRNA synthetase beta chain